MNPVRKAARDFLATNAPSLFRLQRALRYGPVYDAVCRSPHVLRHTWRQLDNHGCLSVEIDAPYGFFGILQTFLLLLCHCDRHGLYPHIAFRGANYARFPADPDWFGNYFTLKMPMPPAVRAALAEGKIRTSRILDIADLGYRLRYERHLTLPRAHALFETYVAIRPDILAEVDRFVAREFGARTLGVHLRGTDKTREAPEISWDMVVAAVRRHLAADRAIDTVFVSSDEPAFLDDIRGLDLGARVVIYECKHLFYGGKAAHYEEGDGYQKGKEALVSSLLLSRCDACIKTVSFLSGWSKIFNPALEVTLLGKPHSNAAFFPDIEIWRRQEAAR